MDKAFMKHGYSIIAENAGLTSHFHRSRAENKWENLTTSDELLRFKLNFLEASISHSPNNT